MIVFDCNRNISHDEYVESLSSEEFLVIDADEVNGIYGYHYEPYVSERLIYFKEWDLIYSVVDLEKGVLSYAPKKNGKCYVTPELYKIEIPSLKKLLKNKEITKSNAPDLIKERDGYVCQLCGETDVRTLNVHHIVPRKSPFVVNDFIDSPLNQITLCSNCHRIEHHVLKYGSIEERKEHVKRLFMINGFNWKRGVSSGFYASMDEIRQWNKIDIL